MIPIRGYRPKTISWAESAGVNTVLLKGVGLINCCMCGRYALFTIISCGQSTSDSRAWMVPRRCNGIPKLRLDLGDYLGYGSYPADRLKLVFSISKSEPSINLGHEGFRPEGRVTLWPFLFLQGTDGWIRFGLKARLQTFSSDMSNEKRRIPDPRCDGGTKCPGGSIRKERFFNWPIDLSHNPSYDI